MSVVLKSYERVIAAAATPETAKEPGGERLVLSFTIQPLSTNVGSLKVGDANSQDMDVPANPGGLYFEVPRWAAVKFEKFDLDGVYVKADTDGDGFAVVIEDYTEND